MTLKATLTAHRDFIIAPVDRRLFGTFVEHLGRCVYGGIYEPGHKTADENGFRRDVLELTRELGVTIVRYPGGNFLSGYNWEDGVGPKDQRPVRLDLAWASTETNQFGTNEFITWCRKTDIEPMFAVNLGTRGPDEARNFLEYCNHPGGTHYSDLRRAHGYEQPHGIRFWCLGNEMDGPWQICAKTAHEYGRIAQETAKVMRWVDADLTLAACGSSQRAMPTYAAWEYEVLDTCFEQVDFISLHAYFRNDADDLPEFLAEIDNLDHYIKEIVAVADAVAAKRRSKKRIMLSLDEWNVWYRTHHPEFIKKPGWPQAPELLEEIYNFEDALVVGGVLITLLNNADRVKVACLAQLVNVIGAIFTETGGPAWRQTVFHPFADASRAGHGDVLRLGITTSTFHTKMHGDVPHLLATAIRNPETGTVSLLALNRGEEAMALSFDLSGLGAEYRIADATQLHHTDRKAINSRRAPDTVSPVVHDSARITGAVFAATLKPLSWNAFTLTPVA